MLSRALQYSLDWSHRTETADSGSDETISREITSKQSLTSAAQTVLTKQQTCCHDSDARRQAFPFAHRHPKPS